jgi:hypothetical protein
MNVGRPGSSRAAATFLIDNVTGELLASERSKFE